MNSFLLKFSVVVGLFSTHFANSQFTYLEVGVNNTNVLYESPSRLNSNTHYHNFSLRVNAISRFIRNFGIGGEINIPLVQGNGFDFTGSYSPTGGTFLDFEDPVNNNRYVPQEFDYSFKNSVSGALFGRIYLSTILNPYIDVKLSFVSTTERFIFKRDEIPAVLIYGNYYPKIQANDIDYQMKHKLLVPGFAFGIQPHVSKKLFIDFSLGVDLYTFKNDPFSYEVIYDWDAHNGSAKTVLLESKARSTKAGVLINLGMGYFF